MTSTKQLFCKFGVLFLVLHENAGVQRFDDEISIAIVEKGKKQLMELEEKSHLPRYGECWLHALDHLRDGCRFLTDTIHVDLALLFTNCFMEMSGQERLDCVSERTEALKRLCMSEMSDRAFSVYTEFFTQTENMCFFLQSQRWQIQADQTIDRLSVRSREVSEQLEVVSEVQATVLEQQKEGVRMQGEMLQLGRHLSKTLNGSQDVLNRLTLDLRNSTKEHQAVLKELFREFYMLHSWIVGKYAFVDRVLFYFSFLVAVMVATSTKRTGRARSYLILNLMGSALVELNLPLLFPGLDDIQKDRIHWLIRKLFALTGSFIFVLYCYRYQDENAKLLNEIKEQNRQIMESILRMKLEPPVALRTSPKQANEDQQSAVGSYVSRSQDSYREASRRFLSPSSVAEPDTTDYEKENSSNERRSMSRSLRPTPEREERAARMREPSRTSESSVSRVSRYNLRRKT